MKRYLCIIAAAALLFTSCSAAGGEENPASSQLESIAPSSAPAVRPPKEEPSRGDRETAVSAGDMASESEDAPRESDQNGPEGYTEFVLRVVDDEGEPLDLPTQTVYFAMPSSWLITPGHSMSSEEIGNIGDVGPCFLVQDLQDPFAIHDRHYPEPVVREPFTIGEYPAMLYVVEDRIFNQDSGEMDAVTTYFFYTCIDGLVYGASFRYYPENTHFPSSGLSLEEYREIFSTITVGE